MIMNRKALGGREKKNPWKRDRHPFSRDIFGFRRDPGWPGENSRSSERRRRFQG